MASPSPILGPDSHEELLLEFRVGKMIMEATTVKPDLRKGLLRLIRGDGFLRIQWRERSQEAPEDDILVFPQEANFVKVQQSSGRVYLLKFKHDDRKHFFWMQEPNDKEDARICETVEFYLNYQSPESDDEEEDNVDMAEPSSENPQTSDLSKVEVENHQSRGAAAPTTLHSIGAPAQAAVQLEDLQRILSSITPLAAGAVDLGPSLSDVLKPELVVPLLEETHVDERLTQYLPEGSWTPEAIGELMQSPQFHQQVDAFTHVLRSGQIDLSQFGIDSSKYNFTVLSFLEAIEDLVTKKADVHNSSTQGSNDNEGDRQMEGGAR